MTLGLSLAAAPSSMRVVEFGARADCCSGSSTSSLATVFQVNYGVAGVGMGSAVWAGRRARVVLKGQQGQGKRRGRAVVECVQSERSGKAGVVVKIFDVEDPRGSGAGMRSNGSGTFDVNMAWELLRQDVLYLDWKARQDVLAIVAAHDKVRWGHWIDVNSIF